ncbi:MAG: tetratricopeptide repeat protein, partial [Alphaproteobacteria bacterium]
PRKAQAIWSVLALQGSAKAQYSLALLLETGQGPVEPNIKQAIRFYAMAADAGIAEAQTNLGLLYAQGRGV